MKGFRLRLSVLLWLVAIAAAFLAGVRYRGVSGGTSPSRRLDSASDRPDTSCQADQLPRRTLSRFSIATHAPASAHPSADSLPISGLCRFRAT